MVKSPPTDSANKITAKSTAASTDKHDTTTVAGKHGYQHDDRNQPRQQLLYDLQHRVAALGTDARCAFCANGHEAVNRHLLWFAMFGWRGA